ncbi:MAG: LacI family DNA-binding transcriptional regulator [Luteolibacter sp.]
MNERVTMAILAKELGLAASTVSRALRNDERIGEDTRKRVFSHAQQRGYRPNPMVSALMSVRKGTGRSAEVGTMALVTDYRGKDGWRSKDVCRWEYEGICKRADEMGYGVEEFAMGEYGYDGKRLEETLVTRGIRGVLLGFTRERKVPGGFSIERFSVAGLSTYFREVAVNRANFHGFFNVGLAMDEMRAQGCGRIGLVVPELNNRISGYLWSGAALEWQRRLPMEERCVHFLPLSGDEEKEFAEWLEAERPDGLLVYKMPVKSWLAKLGIRTPEDVQVAYLYRTEGEMLEWPGIDGNLQMVGAAAFDLVVEGLHTNRLGAPEHPKEVLIKGEWRGGSASG